MRVRQSFLSCGLHLLERLRAHAPDLVNYCAVVEKERSCFIYKELKRFNIKNNNNNSKLGLQLLEHACTRSQFG